MSKHAARLIRVRQICTSGLRPEIVIPVALEALHALIPSAINSFFWCNERGEPTDFFTDHHLVEASGFLAHRLPSLEAEIGFSFRQLVLFGHQTGNLRALWSRGFESGAAYADIYQQFNLKWTLDGVVRDSTRPWGVLTLKRTADEADFSAAEEALLAQVLPYFLHALRCTPTSPDAYVADGRSALFTFSTSEPNLVAGSPGGEEIALIALEKAEDAVSPLSRSGHHLHQVPVRERLSDIARELRPMLDGSHASQEPPVITVENRWGQFSFRAYRLDTAPGEPELMAVLLEHRVPIELQTLAQVDRLPLTMRQKEVCWLALKGSSNAEIAQALGIGHATLKEYLQGIYGRLEVCGREALIRKMLVRTGTEAVPGSPMVASSPSA